jgi:arylsulfatase A-like enzyme
MYDTTRFDGLQPEPYIPPEQQQGTTPLVKLMAGKLTRDFRNYRQPELATIDFRGPRSIIDGRFKLVIQETATGDQQRELFDLEIDPAETSNLADMQPARVATLSQQLEDWQHSVLMSLRGADY